METFYYQIQISPIEDTLYKDEPGFFENLRSRAARAAAEGIIRKASHYEKILPDSTRPHDPITYRWWIGVETNLVNLEARLKELEQARYEGRQEAAVILYETAERYQGLNGGCGGVIASQLRDSAREILKNGK